MHHAESCSSAQTSHYKFDRRESGHASEHPSGLRWPTGVLGFATSLCNSSHSSLVYLVPARLDHHRVEPFRCRFLVMVSFAHLPLDSKHVPKRQREFHPQQICRSACAPTPGPVPLSRCPEEWLEWSIHATFYHHARQVNTGLHECQNT